MKYSKKIERIIDATIQDGKIDKDEIEVLRMTAAANGIEQDELILAAQQRNIISKNKKDKFYLRLYREFKSWNPGVKVYVVLGVLAAIIVPICLISTSYRSPHEDEEKCIVKVLKNISQNKLSKAEYYVKSYRLTFDSNVITNLIQAYIDNNDINTAVSLYKWASQKYSEVGGPLYEYYMLKNEYLVAEEFLDPGNKKFYEHLKRVVTSLVLSGEPEKAKKYVIAKAQYFEGINDEEFSKQTVVNNLMSIINAE